MVRIEPASPDERFDNLVHELVEKFQLRLDVTGWSRKTYDVYDAGDRHRARRLLLRVESFALTSGEVFIYADEALPLAEAIGTALEQDFGVAEAVVLRRDPPA